MKNDTIKRASEGGGKAFAELFSEVQSELYRVAFIYLKNRDDALDAVQETAYRCFKNISKLKNREYFRTWAVRTLINCCLNMIRSGKRTVPLDDAPVISEGASCENSALASVTLGILMDKLDEREKSVLLMKHLYGMSFSEISKELKLPLGTVKTLLYRATDRLKKENFL